MRFLSAVARFVAFAVCLLALLARGTAKKLPNVPDYFDSVFDYMADGFIELTFRGLRGEHGQLASGQSYGAFRLDALLSPVNISTIHVAFRNGTVRNTSFFTLGMPLDAGSPAHRSAAALAASHGGSMQRITPTLSGEGNVAAMAVASAAQAATTALGRPAIKWQDVFVAGCALPSQEPLGLVGVDLSWVLDPAYQLAYMGEELLNNVTVDHWRSPSCRDIWVLPESAGAARAGLPVRVEVRSMTDTTPVGCQPPTQLVMYTWFQPLQQRQAATTSDGFMPPAQCFPSGDGGGGAGAGGAGADPPAWVWAVLSAVVCLVVVAAVSFLVASCRRSSREDEEEEDELAQPRERFASHLLDVI